MISALVIFTTFSGGCGGAQTMTQLYVKENLCSFPN
jgi:hypothetical protein